MKLTKEVKENIDSYFDNITPVELEKKLIDYNIIPKKELTYNQKIEFQAEENYENELLNRIISRIKN